MKTMGLKEGLIGIGALSIGHPAAPAKPAAERKHGRVVIIK